MSGTGMDEGLVGQKITSSPVVESLICDLVDEVTVQNSSFDTIRQARPYLAENSKKKIEHIGALRGRPLYHNYIGTGAGR